MRSSRGGERVETQNSSHSHRNHIPIVIPKLARDGQTLLAHLESGIPLPGRRQGLIAQTPADGFLAHAGRGLEAERLVEAGVERDGGGLVEEGQDEDVVVEELDVVGQGQGFVDAVGEGGLGAVEHEDVLLVLGHAHGRLARLEGAGEEPGRFQEGAVVVEAPVAAVVLVFGGRVGGADVGGLAPVVPGDDFDEVRLQFEEVEPFVDPDAVVLLVAPVHVRVEAFEEPGCDGGDPFFVCGRAVGCELIIDVGFFGCGKECVDPGEEAVGVGAGFVEGRFGLSGHGAGDEEGGGRKVGEDVGLPVPGWIGVLEGAEHRLPVDE